MPDIFSRYALVGSVRGRRIHVWAVAMSVTDVSNGLGYWSKLWVDAPVYSYLVNNCSPMFTLNVMGVDAVYTDDLAVRDCR
jgi:hypothetical protein